MSGARRRRAAPLRLLAVALAGLAAPRTGHSEPLRAGFAVVALPAPDGAPLAGYGGLRDRVAHGVLDAPEARALLLAGERQRIALLVLDLVIVRPELRAEIARESADLHLDSLTVLATHTHSGPGGYIRGWLAERITSGSFDPGAEQRIAAAGAQALQRAYADLAPARASAALGRADLARNRRERGGPRETELPLLLLRFDGARPPIAVFSYGMHPTVRSPSNHSYSADYVGAARAWLEARGERALFLPGPMGDQGPPEARGGPRDESLRAREIGEELGKDVLLRSESLGASGGGAADVELASAQTSLQLPELRLRRFCALWWLAPLVAGPARRLISQEVPIQALRIGTARIVALPAEPSSELGDAIRERLRQRDAGVVPFVLAHANDWIGYAVTPERYDRGGYEACLSLHGRELGPRLVDAVLQTAERLDSAGSAQP